MVYPVAPYTNQAITKLVPRGGARTARRIKAQLKYISRDEDPNIVVFGSRRHLGAPLDFDRIADAWGNVLGNNGDHGVARDLTSHLVISFPIGTDLAAAEAAGREFIDRVFDNREDGHQFDFVAAFHTDKEHPHFHIIANRRQLGGDEALLCISQNPGHGDREHSVQVSYEELRTELADVAQRHHIPLHANFMPMHAMPRDLISIDRYDTDDVVIDDDDDGGGGGGGGGGDDDVDQDNVRGPGPGPGGPNDGDDQGHNPDAGNYRGGGPENLDGYIGGGRFADVNAREHNADADDFRGGGPENLDGYRGAAAEQGDGHNGGHDGDGGGGEGGFDDLYDVSDREDNAGARQANRPPSRHSDDHDDGSDSEDLGDDRGAGGARRRAPRQSDDHDGDDLDRDDRARRVRRAPAVSPEPSRGAAQSDDPSRTGNEETTASGTRPEQARPKTPINQTDAPASPAAGGGDEMDVDQPSAPGVRPAAPRDGSAASSGDESAGAGPSDRNKRPADPHEEQRPAKRARRVPPAELNPVPASGVVPQQAGAASGSAPVQPAAARGPVQVAQPLALVPVPADEPVGGADNGEGPAADAPAPVRPPRRRANHPARNAPNVETRSMATLELRTLDSRVRKVKRPPRNRDTRGR